MFSYLGRKRYVIYRSHRSQSRSSTAVVNNLPFCTCTGSAQSRSNPGNMCQMVQIIRPPPGEATWATAVDHTDHRCMYLSALKYLHEQIRMICRWSVIWAVRWSVRGVEILDFAPSAAFWADRGTRCRLVDVSHDRKGIINTFFALQGNFFLAGNLLLNWLSIFIGLSTEELLHYYTYTTALLLIAVVSNIVISFFFFFFFPSTFFFISA